MSVERGWEEGGEGASDEGEGGMSPEIHRRQTPLRGETRETRPKGQNVWESTTGNKPYPCP